MGSVEHKNDTWPPILSHAECVSNELLDQTKKCWSRV